MVAKLEKDLKDLQGEDEEEFEWTEYPTDYLHFLEDNDLPW